MSYYLEFTIDALPRMQNAPSRGSNTWHAIKREADLWKNLVYCAVVGRRPKEPLEKAKLILTRFSSVEPDPDGLVSGFKRIVDGLVISGVLKNDSSKVIGFPDYRWRQVARGKGAIQVIVSEIPKPYQDAAQKS